MVSVPRRGVGHALMRVFVRAVLMQCRAVVLSRGCLHAGMTTPAAAVGLGSAPLGEERVLLGGKRGRAVYEVELQTPRPRG